MPCPTPLIIYWGKDQPLLLRVTKPRSIPSAIASSVSLIGAGLEFGLTFDFLEDAILTVPRSAMTVVQTDDRIDASFVVPGATLAAILETEARYSLFWQLVVTPLVGGNHTQQGTAIVQPALPLA